jgi:hypothetical protein
MTSASALQPVPLRPAPEAVRERVVWAVTRACIAFAAGPADRRSAICVDGGPIG